MSAWSGKRVTVMGLGLFGGGAGVARWLAERGARVTVTDLRSASELEASVRALGDCDVHFVLGGHDEEDFAGADCVVANPAVRPDAPLLRAAREAGTRVTSELELFCQECERPQVWISGTQGKSTTSHALASLLNDAGHRARLAGNIGRSLLLELDDARRSNESSTFVVEVSSYQLEWLPADMRERRQSSKVAVAALTNVLSDHLERHGSPEAYAASKARILDVLRPGGCAILPLADDGADENGGSRNLALGVPRDCRRIEHTALSPTSRSRETAVPAADRLSIMEGRFRLGEIDLGATSDLRLVGDFQAANVLVALGAAQALGVSAESLARGIANIRGLPHRMQDLGQRAGRRVVDNGVSTTPDSTLSALRSIPVGCTLLLGGLTKRGLDFAELARESKVREVRVAAFGKGRSAIAESFTEQGVEVCQRETLEEALEAAWKRTPQGQTLLFSPAAASFDAYANFSHRAAAFHAALDRLHPISSSTR